MKKNTPRLVIFAPHFAEYSVRLALALANHAQVLLIVNRDNLHQECSDALLDAASKSVRLFSYTARKRLSAFIASVSIILRILAFRPWICCVQEQIDTATTRVVRMLRYFHPISLTIHDPEPHSGSDMDWVIANIQNRRTIRAAASMIHVHGDFCRKQLQSMIGLDRPIIVTAHGGVLIPRPDQIRSCEAGRILMFGRMEAYKGLEVLLDAMDVLNERRIACALAIVGAGSELNRLENRISHIANVSVRKEFLTPDHAVEEFQKAQIVILPYTDATQSGVAAAAIANRRFIIASRVGGLPDLIREGVEGVLTPPSNALALANAIEAQLKSHAALNYQAIELEWEFIARQLLAFWMMKTTLPVLQQESLNG